MKMVVIDPAILPEKHRNLLLRRAGENSHKGRSVDARSPDHPGGILMRWPGRREAKLVKPRRAVNPRVLELQTAKEILAEVFHARPADVEERS
jgi:hypothetical protein